MAILKNQEVYFVKLDPNRPDKGIGTPANPPKANWNIQLRTTDKMQRKAWADMGLNTKAVREDKTDEESKILYYQTTLRKNAKTLKDNVLVPAKPVEVVDGKHAEVDPNTIGNGSLVNVMLYERKYKLEGVDKVSWILMKVQVVKHKLFTRAPMEDFDDCETEVLIPDDSAKSTGSDEGEDGLY